MPALYQPTRADLRARVRFYIDEVSQANFADADLNYAINDAQQELATELAQLDEQYLVNPVPTTLQFAINVPSYALASDFQKMTRMQDSITGLPIDFTDLNGQDSGAFNTPPLVQSVAISAQATIVGNSVIFNPTPQQASQAVYWYVPIIQDLTGDTDVTSIPRQYVDMLAILAAIDCKIKDEDDTSDLRVKYNRRLDQLKRTARDRQQQNPKRVRRVAR